jgi:hypothetical protein
LTLAGLFGFLLRAPRDQAWIDRRFQAMAAAAVGPRHRVVSVRTPYGAIGTSGPGILPGSLTIHGEAPELQMLAEGEVYHHDERLAHGESAGGPWTMVRAAWLDRGAEAVAGFDGLFTLALVDSETPRLRLINDRYGSRRLYLLDAGSAYVFASALRPLLPWRADTDAFQIDEAFLRQFACLGAPLDDRTWFRGVRLMPPASEIDVTPGRVRERRLWRWDDLPPPSTEPADRMGLPVRLVTPLRESWLRALGARLGGDRVGQQLSGGLDSRLILADAVAIRRDWTAITYGEPGADEVRIAGQAASIAGASWLHLVLPEAEWLETRTRFSVAHDGVVDLVNAFQAGMLPLMHERITWEVSGYLGDFVLGATYEAETAREAMSYLPYWHSPVAMPEAEVQALIEQSVGGHSPRGWLADTKCRRAINAWPHTAVDVIEVRKPFMDHALVEFAAALPRPYRDRHDLHRALLGFHPRLARVAWQKTGVPLDASPARFWLGRARRVAYRGMRKAASAAGVTMRPWVRGAVDLDTWLADGRATATIADTLLSQGSRLSPYFDRVSVQATIDATRPPRTIAHEPLFRLYLAERLLRDLAAE